MIVCFHLVEDCVFTYALLELIPVKISRQQREKGCAIDPGAIFPT